MRYAHDVSGAHDRSEESGILVVATVGARKEVREICPAMLLWLEL
jgi:hypothetical protein